MIGVKGRAGLASLVIAALASTVFVATSSAANPNVGEPVALINSSAIVDPVPGGFASWAELFELQGRMNSAVAEITAAADRLSLSGFGSAVAAPEKRQVEIYWRGVVPASVQAVIDRQRVAVPVAVLPARHTRKELLQAAATLAKHSEYVGVGPLPDASGLQVSARANVSVGAQAQSAVAAVGVAVVIVGETPGYAPASSRQNDSIPYWAGARTKVGGNMCTAGFAVNHGGRTKVLYAAHCLASGFEVDGGGDVMGAITNRNVQRDTSLIDGRGGGKMWDGPWNEMSYAKVVQGASFSNVGNWLCTSGSISGVRCNIQVTGNNQWADNWYPMVYARRMDGANAIGEGDSGGPVFELPSPDNGKVIAKGGITAGDKGYPATCTGLPTNRTCWSRFVYADATQALSYYGASIVTG